MTRSPILLLSLLLGCKSAPAPTAASDPPSPRVAQGSERHRIFRYITIARGQPLQLGEPIDPALLPLLEPQSGTKYRLLDGSFGGSLAIGVDTTETGLVRLFVFVYGKRDDFSLRAVGYMKSLGKPSSWTITAERKVARWEDERTVFVLENDATGTYAILADRALVPSASTLSVATASTAQ